MIPGMKIKQELTLSICCCLSICILLVCAATTAFAQAGRGSISGLVSDPSGAVVPGARITLLSHATGVELHTNSSAGGLYNFVSLNPGVYKVTASKGGFESVAQDNVSVTVDQASTVNIALQVGSVSDTITVTAGVDLVDTSNSTVGTLIGAETIDRVPLLTRNVYDLVQLSAGVAPANGTPNSSTSQTIENISSGRPGIDVSSYTINGALQGSVYYMLDGSPLGVTENNMGAIMPAMEIAEDGVEEARVETQNTSASYQSGGAGVISLVSKSGGNQFHGDAFLVMRPDILAANAWSNKQYQLQNGEKNQPNGFHRYQEGGAISGPILRKKLFFFFDYEQTQQALYDGSNRTTVPTAAERTGDFSGDSFTIYDPTSPDKTTCDFPLASGGTACARQAFVGNRITNPNPVALKFLSEYPLPNTPAQDFWNTNNRFDPGVDPQHEKKFDIRIDWNKGEKERLFGRFTFDRIFQATLNTSHPPAGAFDSTPMWDTNYAQNVSNGRNILIGNDFNLNSTTVLQLRYSFTRHYEVQGGDPAQMGYDITKLGFPAALKAEQLHDTTLPMITFNGGGTSSIGGTCCWNTFIEANQNSDANATVTKVWGKHELSFGGEFMKRFLNGFQPPNPAGDYDFSGSATSEQDQTVASDNSGNPLISAAVVGGNAFASFLTGLSDSGNFTQDLSVAEASPYYAAFVEDNYHPTKTFTVTAGLRWDIFGGKTERHNRLEYFDPNATDTVSGVSFTGAEVYVNGGNRSPFTTNMKDIAPRLGFSWQPVKHLVVRGGGGFYYGPSVQMPSGPSEDSDGYSNNPSTNPSCANADGNVVFNGSPTCIYDNTSNPGGVGNYTGPYSISNPFPVGLTPIISNPTGLANNLGTGLSTMLHSQKTQLAYNFNFGVEYEFPGAVVFSAAYVGSRGLHLPLNSLDLNTLSVQTVEKYQGELCKYPSYETNCVNVPNTWEPIEPQSNYWYGQATIPLYASLGKYPQFTSVAVNGYPGGDSNYHSLQMKLQKRLTAHFTTLVAFTWAKLMTDDAGSATLAFIGNHSGTVQDAMNLNLEHSVSAQDEKYNLTGNVSYDLPIGQGRAVNLSGLANEAFGGWTLGGILFLSTGNPIPALASGQNNTYFNQRANLTCDPGKHAPRKVSQWFTASCFAVPNSPYIPGNSSTYLDHLREMGAADIDMTLSKNFSLGKGKNLRIDINSYNLTNQAQYGMPNLSDVTSINNGGSPTFGQITYTVNNPRQFQGEARFTF
jgi:hypothetical protein